MTQPVRKLKVLVVEDEPVVLLGTMGILESVDIEALDAASADRALEILETHDDIDVVFSDINMPGSLDGYGLALEVDARWPDIGLVLTSGKVPLGRNAVPGHGKFLPKPFSAEALTRAVAEVSTAHGTV